MNIQFVPEWLTPSGNLATMPEGSQVSIHLEVQESGSVAGVTGQFQQAIGSTYADVTALYGNGLPLQFRINADDQDIQFATLQAPAELTIYRTPQVTFSLLNGALPTGLSLSSTGVISGATTHISPDTSTFAFSVRVTNGSFVRDRSFTILLDGAVHAAYFNTVTMPPSATDQAANVTYRNLGTYSKGSSFLYTIDVLQQEQITPILSIEYIDGMNESSTKINGLPPGLFLSSDRQLEGTIGINAAPGMYYFQIYIKDPVAPSSMICGLQVSTTPLAVIDVPLTLSWITPAGLVGALETLVPSAYGVTAVSNRATIVYSLDPLSDPLPAGITLNATTGDFEGIPLRVATPTTYSMIIRATLGLAFIRAIFSVSVSSTFTSDMVCTVNLAVDVETASVINTSLAALIPNGSRFRPTDIDFGATGQLKIHIINGIVASPGYVNDLIAVDVSSIANTSFYYTLSLITAGYRLSTVVDPNGIPLYDVIYRKLIDPQAGAGGFGVDLNSNLIRTPVLDRNRAIIEPFYVNSIENIRNDLIVKYGFASSPQLAHVVGANSPEQLPAWMMGTYIPGFVVAYLKPGLGNSILKAINADLKASKMGQVISFDILYFSSPLGDDILQLQ